MCLALTNNLYIINKQDKYSPNKILLIIKNPKQTKPNKTLNSKIHISSINVRIISILRHNKIIVYMLLNSSIQHSLNTTKSQTPQKKHNINATNCQSSCTDINNKTIINIELAPRLYST